METTETLLLRARQGDSAAVEALLESVQDMVFNLALRMLGDVPDAEDATQEVLLKVTENLDSFEQKSAFSTWVFRIAKNDLIDYRRSRFADHPLSFEIYGQDIACAQTDGLPDQTGGVDRRLLARELKLCCTNVMLQCLNPESRLIFVLGTMFRLDSRLAAELLDISPDAYRQRLSRVRKKVAAFLSEYCGLSGTGSCGCEKRVDYAILSRRVNPERLEFCALEECAKESLFIGAMDRLDEQAGVFSRLPVYRAPEKAMAFIRGLLASGVLSPITGRKEG